MRRILTILSMIVVLCTPVKVHAEALDILIAEVQTESTASASEEYVVLVNNSARAVDLSDWHVQYFSAGAADFSTPTRNIVLGGTLVPHDTFLIASSGYRSSEAAANFGATLAAAGGHIRLVSGAGASEVQHDLVGWGTASHPEGTPVTVAAKGQHYSRKTNQYGTYLDTDNNLTDFENGTIVSAPTSGESDGQSQAELPISSTDGLVEISELLPDPASPLTDAEGEFIELHNPTATPISLVGYKLQSGSTYSYSYTFKEGSLAAGAYQAFYVSQTKLTLSNSGGRARLLDTDGGTVSETAAYGKAVTGSVWTLFEGEWIWSGTPTPGLMNIATTPTDTASSKAATQSSTKGAATKAATSKAKTSTAKASSTKASKASDANTTTEYKEPAADNQALPISPVLLAVVGVPLVGYMVYEYRHDLGNFFAKSRRHRSPRGEPGPLPSGR